MKRPHTYFSTEFHGGPRAVRARLGNLFAAPRRSGRLLLLCTVLLVGALGGLVACDAARDGERNPFPVPDEVYAMALELAGPGGETVDLKLAFSAEAVLPGATLEAYTMEPGARPEDPEGHAFDAAFTFLVVRLEEGARSLLGSFSVGADAGAPEYAVADYLRASGNEDAGRRLSFLRLLSDADAVVAPFLDRAEIEGAPVSDENGVVWRRLAGYEKQEGLPMEDQLLSQLRRVFAQDLAERLMQRSDGTFREWNDGLWIRSDAAERLGWDFTADLATLRFSGAYGWDTAVVDGTARGAPIEWHFRMSEDGDLRPYFIHYYSLCGEGWPSDAECAFLLGGAWYVLFQQGEPDLGAPLSSENWTGDSGYEGSRFLTRTWDGVEVRYSVDEAADLATAYAVSVTAPGIPNWRGIEVGSTRAAVLAAYPELDEAEQEKQNGTRDLLFWGRPVGGTFVGFRLENDVVVQMDSQFVSD